MGVELTVVVENTAVDDRLAVEHGLAVHIADGDRSFLFDTSATPQALVANAEALSIDLSGVEGVILSHGHHDHTGGVAAVLSARPGVAVYAHPDVFAPRWADRPNEPRRQIGWASGADDLSGAGATFCPVAAPLALTGAVRISGPISGPQPQVDRFRVRTGAGEAADEFADEVFLMLRGLDGWAVLTGCCHRGLPNTLRAAARLAAGDPIVAVCGGFHLGPAGPETLAQAADAIAQANPDAIYPCHCTGRAGREYLAERFGEKVRQIHGGTRLSF